MNKELQDELLKLKETRDNALLNFVETCLNMEDLPRVSKYQIDHMMKNHKFFAEESKKEDITLGLPDNSSQAKDSDIQDIMKNHAEFIRELNIVDNLRRKIESLEIKQIRYRELAYYHSELCNKYLDLNSKICKEIEELPSIKVIC